jgi:hypothetical protein
MGELLLPTKFEVENFRFKAFQGEGTTTVSCVVQSLLAGPIIASEVRDTLADMGKWESLQELLQNLHLSKGEENLPENFGAFRYEYTVKQEAPGSMEARVTFKLTQAEALRRTGGDADEAAGIGVSTREIKLQIQNIAKWRDFENVVKNVSDIKYL